MVTCAVLLPDGLELALLVRNRGFVKSGYLTTMYLDGRKFESFFSAKFYKPTYCANPDQRLAHDLEAIEREVMTRYGCVPEEVIDLV